MNIRYKPKIIQCKDCANRHSFDCPMYFEEDIEWEEDGYIERDTVYHDNTEDDYFCSQGAKREDERFNKPSISD